MFYFPLSLASVLSTGHQFAEDGTIIMFSSSLELRPFRIDVRLASVTALGWVCNLAQSCSSSWSTPSKIYVENLRPILTLWFYADRFLRAITSRVYVWGFLIIFSLSESWNLMTEIDWMAWGVRLRCVFTNLQVHTVMVMIELNIRAVDAFSPTQVIPYFYCATLRLSRIV